MKLVARWGSLAVLAAAVSFGSLSATAQRTAEPSTPETSECWLVWTEHRGEAVTTRLCDGARVEERPGIHLMVEGRAFEVDVQRVASPQYRCTDTGDDYEEDGEHTVTSQELVLIEGGARTVLLAALDRPAPTQLDDAIRVLGSFGPYLAVHRSTLTADACGAYPLETSELSWFDLRTGAQLELPGPPRAATAPARRRLARELDAHAGLRDALAAFGREWEPEAGHTIERDFVQDALSFSALGPAPRLRRGRSSFEYLVSVSIGENVDTLHMTTRTDDVPSHVQPYAEVPPMVACYLATQRGDHGGWTRYLE